jgi:hypothetical protein
VKKPVSKFAFQVHNLQRYVVEVLGDFDSFYDIFVDTAMGSISFYQMVYFVMVTVSTVGGALQVESS